LIYTHVLNKGGRGVRSPLDAVGEVPRAAGDPGSVYVVAAHSGKTQRAGQQLKGARRA